MSHNGVARANRRLLKRLSFIAVGMFGFGFALVPLYDVFCDVTGLNGKTGRVREADLSGVVDRSRWVTVIFDATVNENLPWEFVPAVGTMKVHPGEVAQASYTARNLADVAIKGQAIPSLSPGLMARYFHKTECFCFTEQLLKAHERKEMPLRFVVDPDLPREIDTVTLSYTFFDVGRGGDATGAKVAAMD